MRLYYGDQVAAQGAEPLVLAQPRSAFPQVRGKIGHHGGLRVAETERHNGLAWLLCRLTRAMTLYQWPDVEWHCGNTLGHVEKRGLPKNTYGYTGWDLFFDGWFHLTKQEQKMFMTSINHEEMMLQIGEDLSLIEMHTQEQVRDVVRAARERESDAAPAGGDNSLIKVDTQEQVSDIVRAACERQSDAPVLSVMAS